MKKILLIISVIILIILSVLAYFYLIQNKRVCCLDSPCSDNLNGVVEQGDIRLCDTVQFKNPEQRRNPFYDNECREGCIAEIAYHKEDPSLCSYISNIKNIASEQERINGWPNLKKAGFSIKDRCYRAFAEKRDDVSLCAQSETPWAKETCKQLLESPELRKYRR